LDVCLPLVRTEVEGLTVGPIVLTLRVDQPRTKRGRQG